MPANSTLKTNLHTGYDPVFATWRLPSGTAAFGSTKSLDCQLPGTLILPSRQYFIGFICAKSNAYIVFPNTAYIYTGFWLNNTADSYWIKGSNPFTLTGAVIGNPATTTDRKYKVFARTDRATSFLSTELDFPTAPDDTAFSLGASVSLTWPRLNDIGIISYDVYRNTGSTFTLLQEVESGANTYVDNNVQELNVIGYPTATDDRSIALTTTRTLTTESVLDTMAVDGVSARWSTLSFPIPVPFDYDAGTPPISGDDGLQWLRIGVGGLTGDYADLDLPLVTVSGGTTVTTTYGLFEDFMASDSLAVRLDNGVTTYTSTIVAFIDSDHITIGDTIPDGDYDLYIIGGAGPHCIYIDCVQASYADGATFSNNDSDLTPPRPQFPRARPNGSNQGGTGGTGEPGGGGEPNNGCPEENEPISVLFGNSVMQKRSGDVKVGDVVVSGNIAPNYMDQVERIWCADLWIIETQNGCSLTASPTHPVHRNNLDRHGTPMEVLTSRSKVLTVVNGVCEQSKIRNLGPTGMGGWTMRFACRPTPTYVVGNCEAGVGGIVSHNKRQ